MEEDIKTAAKLIVEAKRTVALTGAGISTESGISDFRTPGKGLWAKYDPAIYANYNVFMTNPSLYWQMAKDTRRKVLDAEPNQAHLSLAELENMGQLECVITQNIDNLHQRAGSTNVIELHGTARTATCMLCAKKYDFQDVFVKLDSDEIPPQCDCGGVLKSDTILFGEPMPIDAITSARHITEEADLMLVVGSSLEVFPANSLPQIMWGREGTRLILVNLSNTPFDYMWDVALFGHAGKILPKIITHIKAILKSEM